MTENLNNKRVERELINLIKSYPSIWDAQDPQYKNRILKRSNFDSVTLQLKQRLPHFCIDISADAVQSKWKNLRTYFNKQLKLRRGLSTNELYKSKWKHFNSMLFLINTFDLMETKYISTDTENETPCSSEVDIFNRDSESDEDSQDYNSISLQHVKTNDVLGTVQIVKIEDINNSNLRSSPCDLESDLSNSTLSKKTLQHVKTNDSLGTVQIVKIEDINNSNLSSSPCALESDLSNSALSKKTKRKTFQTSASHIEKEVDANTNSVGDIEDDYGKLIAKQMRLIPVREREDIRLSIQKIIADAVRKANST